MRFRRLLGRYRSELKPVGTYHLASINAGPLPYEIFTVEILSDSMTVRSDNTYTGQGTSRYEDFGIAEIVPDTESHSGSWVRTGDTLRFTPTVGVDGPFDATYSGLTLTVNAGLIGMVCTVLLHRGCLLGKRSTVEAAMRKLLALVVLLLVGCESSSTEPEIEGAWITTKEWSGNGNKVTETFTVPAEWRIEIVAVNNAALDVDGILSVFVHDAAGGLVSVATTVGTATDTSYVQAPAGVHYLDINAALLDWTVRVQRQ